MRVLISDPISDKAINVLKSAGLSVDVEEPTPDELLNIINEYDALLVRSRTKVTSEVIDRGSNLKVIGRAGVGVDNIDVSHANEKGITVVNSPGASAESVAELALSLMLSLARKVTVADSGMKQGKWEKKKLKGTELQGKTLGIIGFGKIGRRVGELGHAFGMKVIYHDPYMSGSIEWAEGVNFDTLISESDYLSLHTVLTDSTRHMINYDVFKKMKKSAYLVNCARGAVVDEEALIKALEEGLIAGAGLDVYESEPPTSRIIEMPNTVLTPHVGANTKEAQDRAGIIVAEQVIKVLKGEKPDHYVGNLPG